jgi:hypothetical protein
MQNPMFTDTCTYFSYAKYYFRIGYLAMQCKDRHNTCACLQNGRMEVSRMAKVKVSVGWPMDEETEIAKRAARRDQYEKVFNAYTDHSYTQSRLEPGDPNKCEEFCKLCIEPTLPEQRGVIVQSPFVGRPDEIDAFLTSAQERASQQGYLLIGRYIDDKIVITLH